MKVYVDTNVLIDYVCQRTDFALSANRLIALGCLGKVHLQTSALSYVTAMYVAHKYGYQEVKDSLLFLSGFVEILNLCGTTVVDMLSADWKDYEDATQHATAQKGCADCIITRNVKDFKQSTLPVYTVDRFFEVLATNNE